MNCELGIIEYAGYTEKETCGYCRSEQPHFNTHGMWTYRLTGKGYQALIDRGWRRSGKYCYKPHMQDTCCPAYTIRCDAMNVRLTKSQRKVMKRFYDFINYDKKPTGKQSTHVSETRQMENEMQQQDFVPDSEQDAMCINNAENSQVNYKEIDATMVPSTSQTQHTQSTCEPIDTDKPYLVQLQRIKSNNSKAKNQRILRRIQKTMKKQNVDELKAYMLIQQKHKRRLESKQNMVSSSHYFNMTPLPGAKHTFQLKIVQSTDPDSMIACHRLYQKYQQSVHKDDEDKLGFNRFSSFLVEHPIVRRPYDGVQEELHTDLPTHYDSYFMQYWIDDTLIAVGVVDILYSCLSSVYFFYDPDYDFLSLGIFSALKEIDLVRKLNTINPNIKHYYMGYYIHDVIKMKYKRNYYPSYLLCPETYTYCPIDLCLPKLDKSKYSRLCEDPTVTCPRVDYNRMLILNNRIIYYLNEYRMLAQTNSNYRKVRPEVLLTMKEFAELCGQEALDEMVYLVKL